MKHKNSRRFFLPVLWISLLCVFTLTCQQDDPLQDFGLQDDDFSETPVFQFSDAASGVQIEAGVNNFYMSASYDTLSDERIIFNSQFIKVDDCTADCEEALRFYIQSTNPEYTSGDVLSNQAITIGEYNFSGGQTLNIGEVVIEYVSKDGITYQSDQIQQPDQSTFKIISAADYQRNENSNPTKIVEIELSCQLQAVDGSQLFEFSDARATIAIAYPE